MRRQKTLSEKIVQQATALQGLQGWEALQKVLSLLIFTDAFVTSQLQVSHATNTSMQICTSQPRTCNSLLCVLARHSVSAVPAMAGPTAEATILGHHVSCGAEHLHTTSVTLVSQLAAGACWDSTKSF